MNKIKQFVDTLKSRNILIYLQGGDIKVKASKGVLNKEEIQSEGRRKILDRN